MTAKVYSIDSLDGITAVNFFRSPTTEDFYSAIDDVAKRELNHLRFWDLTCGVEWTSTQAEKVAIYAKLRFKTPFSKAAIVAPDDLTYGLFRVHDVFREDGLVEQMVFRTKQDALTWLKHIE